MHTHAMCRLAGLILHTDDWINGLSWSQSLVGVCRAKLSCPSSSHPGAALGVRDMPGLAWPAVSSCANRRSEVTALNRPGFCTQLEPLPVNVTVALLPVETSLSHRYLWKCHTITCGSVRPLPVETSLSNLPVQVSHRYLWPVEMSHSYVWKCHTLTCGNVTPLPVETSHHCLWKCHTFTCGTL